MSHDVVVIGGGLVGTAAAHYLAQGGASVCLVEQGDLNRGASGQNAGSLHFQMEHRLIEHGEAMTALAATILPLSLDAIDRWGAITDALGEDDLDVVMHGGLMLAETPEQVEKLERKRVHEEKWGLPTRLLDAGEVSDLAPYLGDSVLAAGFCPVEGHGNPRLITSALARSAMSQGTVFRTGTRVLATRRTGGRWQVDTEDGAGTRERVTCDMILNAAGAWTGQIATLADLHLPVLPVALTMNATTQMQPTIGHLIQHVGRRISMKQLREGNVLIGGGWSARLQRTGDRFDLARPAPDPASIQGNIDVALDLVPMLEQAHLLRSWTGTVGVTSDSLPILGEVPQAPGYHVATGGSGFTLGLTYGALMAELMRTGRTDLDIALFSPARFNHVNMFMGPK